MYHSKQNPIMAGAGMLLAAALSMAAIVSCNKSEEPVEAMPAETGTLNIRIGSEDGFLTKANTEEKDYEKKISSIQIFVFGADNTLNAYKNLGTSQNTSISTTIGKKTVWAIVNGPDMSSVKTVGDLIAKEVELKDNSYEKGFVMSGSANCTVSTSNTACEITVSRLVSRITLESVVNNLPAALGGITVNRVFLTNAPGKRKINGEPPVTELWCNKEGRPNENPLVKEHIIDGKSYPADAPQMTFKEHSDVIGNGATKTYTDGEAFYCFPNNSNGGIKGFSGQFQQQSTALVVVATIDGKTQYYPVVLKKAAMERNKSYAVSMTITGFGSDDPNTEVSKESVSFSIKIAGWTSGADYVETI